MEICCSLESRHPFSFGLNYSPRRRVLQPDAECSSDRDRQAVGLFVDLVTPERLGGPGGLLRPRVLQLADEGDSDLAASEPDPKISVLGHPMSPVSQQTHHCR